MKHTEILNWSTKLTKVPNDGANMGDDFGLF